MSYLFPGGPRTEDGVGGACSMSGIMLPDGRG
jgi:hypothetical protein